MRSLIEFAAKYCIYCYSGSFSESSKAILSYDRQSGILSRSSYDVSAVNDRWPSWTKLKVTTEISSMVWLIVCSFSEVPYHILDSCITKQRKRFLCCIFCALHSTAGLKLLNADLCLEAPSANPEIAALCLIMQASVREVHTVSLLMGL